MQLPSADLDSESGEVSLYLDDDDVPDVIIRKTNGHSVYVDPSYAKKQLKKIAAWISSLVTAAVGAYLALR